MCIDTRVDICVGMCIGMCIDMYVGMYVGMCVDMCTGVSCAILGLQHNEDEHEAMLHYLYTFAAALNPEYLPAHHLHTRSLACMCTCMCKR